MYYLFFVAMRVNNAIGHELLKSVSNRVHTVSFTSDKSDMQTVVSILVIYQLRLSESSAHVHFIVRNEVIVVEVLLLRYDRLQVVSLS